MEVPTVKTRFDTPKVHVEASKKRIYIPGITGILRDKNYATDFLSKNPLLSKYWLQQMGSQPLETTLHIELSSLLADEHLYDFVFSTISDSKLESELSGFKIKSRQKTKKKHEMEKEIEHQYGQFCAYIGIGGKTEILQIFLAGLCQEKRRNGVFEARVSIPIDIDLKETTKEKYEKEYQQILDKELNKKMEDILSIKNNNNLINERKSQEKRESIVFKKKSIRGLREIQDVPKLEQKIDILFWALEFAPPRILGFGSGHLEFFSFDFRTNTLARYGGNGKGWPITITNDWIVDYTKKKREEGLSEIIIEESIQNRKIDHDGWKIYSDFSPGLVRMLEEKWQGSINTHEPDNNLNNVDGCAFYALLSLIFDVNEFKEWPQTIFPEIFDFGGQKQRFWGKEDIETLRSIKTVAKSIENEYWVRIIISSLFLVLIAKVANDLFGITLKVIHRIGLASVDGRIIELITYNQSNDGKNAIKYYTGLLEKFSKEAKEKVTVEDAIEDAKQNIGNQIKEKIVEKGLVELQEKPRKTRIKIDIETEITGLKFRIWAEKDEKKKKKLEQQLKDLKISTATSTASLPDLFSNFGY